MCKSIFIVVVSVLCVGQQLMGQTQVHIYSDLGANNLSAGAFLKTAAIANYSLQNYSIGGGFQSNIVALNPNLISAVTCNASRNFSVKNIPYSAGLFYMWNNNSELLNQSLWGLKIQREKVHWTTQFGLFFRTYAYTPQAQVKYNFVGNDKVHENWNLMYSIDYSINPKDSIWNAGVRLSNVDNFGINQATNPVLNVHGMIRLSEKLDIMGEVYYLTSGAFNLHVNYFGYLIRTGVVWNID